MIRYPFNSWSNALHSCGQMILMYSSCKKNGFPAFPLPTNLGQPMHRQSAMSVLPSPNLAAFLLLDSEVKWCFWGQGPDLYGCLVWCHIETKLGHNSILFSQIQYDFCSSGIAARQECSADGERDPGSVPQVARDLPLAAHPPRARGAAQDMRGHPRTGKEDKKSSRVQSSDFLVESDWFWAGYPTLRHCTNYFTLVAVGFVQGVTKETSQPFSTLWLSLATN